MKRGSEEATLRLGRLRARSGALRRACVFARYEPQRRCPRLRGQDAVHDACGVAAVLCAIYAIDLIAGCVVRFNERHVPLDAFGPDTAFVVGQSSTEPRAGAALHRSDVEVVAEANHPHSHGISQRAVASSRRDLQLLRPRDLVELARRPCVHMQSPPAQWLGRSDAGGRSHLLHVGIKHPATAARKARVIGVLPVPPRPPECARTVCGLSVEPEIREFLTSRRARITPQRAALPTYGGKRRRVSGLRREEVALLAGISVEYYTRLERGNARGFSEAVLEAISQALQLGEAEHAHLLDLVRTATARRRPRRTAGPQRVRPSVARIVDAMTTMPACVLNGRLDILYANDLAKALFSDVLRDAVRPPNLARFAFLDPRAKALWVDWEKAAGTPWRSCAPRQGATRTTAPCPSLSASCPLGARTSACDGRGTTCSSIAPAASSSTIRW